MNRLKRLGLLIGLLAAFAMVQNGVWAQTEAKEKPAQVITKTSTLAASPADRTMKPPAKTDNYHSASTKTHAKGLSASQKVKNKLHSKTHKAHAKSAWGKSGKTAKSRHIAPAAKTSAEKKVVTKSETKKQAAPKAKKTTKTKTQTSAKAAK